MTPAALLALIEAITAALGAIRNLTPEEVAAVERVAWAWFHRQADEPARLALPFAPALDELRDELMSQARGGRVSSPTAATERPPALPKTPTGDDDA